MIARPRESIVCPPSQSAGGLTQVRGDADGQLPASAVQRLEDVPISAIFSFAGQPYRGHMHSVVRMPNGNDYGKDRLRQPYQQHRQLIREACTLRSASDPSP